MSDWSSDVCSSDLPPSGGAHAPRRRHQPARHLHRPLGRRRCCAPVSRRQRIMDRPCRLQGERRAGAAAMKISNTASAVRVTLSPTEISDLQFVIEAAERAGHYMHARVPNIMAALTRSADDVRMKRSEEHTSELQSLMRISYD